MAPQMVTALRKSEIMNDGAQFEETGPVWNHDLSGPVDKVIDGNHLLQSSQERPSRRPALCQTRCDVPCLRSVRRLAPLAMPLCQQDLIQVRYLETGSGTRVHAVLSRELQPDKSFAIPV
jgi:hypothetical protein